MKPLLLRGAQVITMAAGRPDVECIDILIEGERIAAIGENLSPDSADVADLRGRIVIPGLINAHLHTWQTALRGVGADWTMLDYLSNLHGGLAGRYAPDDMRVATFAGALNQINCGVTTLGDWCHNTPSPDHAAQAVQGLADARIRAVFMHGTPYSAADAPHPLGEIDSLLNGPIRRHPLLTLGMAIKGPQLSTPAVALADFHAANERGLVVSMHQSGGQPTPAWAAVRDAGLIGPRTNIVHGADLSDEWLKTFVDAGASFTITPENELGQGHGIPITGRLLKLGAAPSLGTDVDTVVSSEILLAARMAAAHQRGIDHLMQRHLTGTSAEKATVTSKQALSWATVEGARALGLSEHVGRLLPGMQADLVVIDATALNLWPAHDAVAAALHASIVNIESVMIAGQWRKRDHELLGVELDEVADRLLSSGEHLLQGLNKRGILAGLKRRVVRRVVGRRLANQARR
jgi:5-methylthioadenosine/S-adenosylhomocysteine deaminase